MKNIRVEKTTRGGNTIMEEAMLNAGISRTELNLKLRAEKAATFNKAAVILAYVMYANKKSFEVKMLAWEANKDIEVRENAIATLASAMYYKNKYSYIKSHRRDKKGATPKQFKNKASKAFRKYFDKKTFVKQNNYVFNKKLLINLQLFALTVNPTDKIVGLTDSFLNKKQQEAIKIASKYEALLTKKYIHQVFSSKSAEEKNDNIKELLSFCSAIKAEIKIFENIQNNLTSNKKKLDLAIENKSAITVVANNQELKISPDLRKIFVDCLNSGKMDEFKPDFEDMFLTRTKYLKDSDTLVCYLKKNYDLSEKSQIKSLKKEVLKKEEYRSVLSIFLSQKNGMYTTVSMPENAGTARGYFPAQKEALVPVNMTKTTGAAKKISHGDFAPFTDSLVSITCDKVEDANSLLGAELYVKVDGISTLVCKKIKNKETKKEFFIDLLTGEKIKTFDGERYIAFGYSPSKLRLLTCYFIKASIGEKKIDEMINDLTSGGYGIIKGNKVDLKGGAKNITRLFAWLAPSVPFTQMKAYAFYNGEWKDERKSSVDFGKALADGVAFLAKTSFVRGYEKILGLSVDPHAINGQVQCRPFFTNKCSAEIMNDKVLYNFIKNHYKIVRFTYDEITPEIQAELENWKTGKYAGMVVIIGETHEDLPEFFSDRNVMKINHDFSKHGDINVLDIAQVSGAHTSVQMLQKGLYKDVKACEEFIMNSFVNTFLNKIKEQLDEKQASVPSIEEITDKLWISELVQKIMPKFALTKERSVLTSTIKNMARGMARRINRMNFDIDGSNLRLLPDISFMVGAENLVKIGEVYSKDAVSYKNNKIKELEDTTDDLEKVAKLKNELNHVKNEFKIAIFKYPSIGVKEYILGTPINYKTIEARINALSISEDDKEFLRDYYKNMSPASIVIPAYSFVMCQLAGLDFDFDGCTVVYDPEFIKILTNDYKIYVVNIEDDKNGDKKENKNNKSRITAARAKTNKDIKKTNKEMFVVGQSMFNAIFVKQIANGNLGVGIITKLHDNILAAQRSNCPEKYLELIFKDYEKTSKVYQGLKKEEKTIDGHIVKMVHVSLLEADRIINNMRHVVVTEDNVDEIYEDLDAIFRMYQEKTIDSAKTGETVPVDKDLMFECKSLIDYKMDLNIDFRESLISKINTEPRVAEDKIIKGDILSVLREEMFNEVIATFEGNDTVKGLFDEIEEVGFNEEEIGNLRLLCGNIKPELNYLFEIKKLYNSLSASFANDIKNASDDDEAMSSASKLYKKRVSILSSMIRHHFEGMAPEELGKLVKMAALNSSKGIINSTSSFALKVCSEEYLAYLISEGHAEIDVCGSPILSNKGAYEDGEYVKLNKGVGVGIITKDAISGIFEIKDIDGKLYVTKDILDILPIPEIEDKIIVQLGYKFNNKTIDEQNKILNILSSATEIEIKPYNKNIALFADGQYVYHLEGANRDFKDSTCCTGKLSEIIKTPVSFNNKDSMAILISLDNVVYKEAILSIEEFDCSIDNITICPEAAISVSEDSGDNIDQSKISKKETKGLSKESELNLDLSFFA